MGFEAIISAIASEAADQVAEIRADTATQVAEIVDAAREAAELDQRRLQHGRDEEADRGAGPNRQPGPTRG